MITDQYAAGIFDGEGCIASSAYYSPGKYEKFPRVSIQIAVANNHRGLLEEFVTKYGGKVWTKSKDRRCLAWRLHSKKPMRDFLLAVLPYLIVKKEEALLSFQFIDTIREDNLGCLPLDFEVHAQRKVIHFALRKRKGHYNRKTQGFAEDMAGNNVT